jgi:hypothetical protein
MVMLQKDTYLGTKAVGSFSVQREDKCTRCSLACRFLYVRVIINTVCSWGFIKGGEAKLVVLMLVDRRQFARYRPTWYRDEELIFEKRPMCDQNVDMTSTGAWMRNEYNVLVPARKKICLLPSRKRGLVLHGVVWSS